MPDINTIETKFNISLETTSETAEYWFNELVLKYKENLVDFSIINAAKNRQNAIKIYQDTIVQYNLDHELSVSRYGIDTFKRSERYKIAKANNGILYSSTGIFELDTYTNGYRNKDLWTIGGKEGIGKSWLLLRLAKNLDEYLKLKNITRSILFVNNEMDTEECEDRLDSIGAKISYEKLIGGNLDKKETFRFQLYLRRLKTNIIIVDDCNDLTDVERYMILFNPVVTFIDGSHLLAKDFDWKDIYTLTMQMKKLTRRLKIPIINSTHIKSGKGKVSRGGDLDDFAYGKGYTRDSDVAAIMFASPVMEVDGKFGLDFLKIRRGNKVRFIFENDFSDSSCKVSEVSKVTSGLFVDDDSNILN